MQSIEFEKTDACKGLIEDQLEEYGMCCVTNVLSKSRVEDAVRLTWNLLEEMSPNLDRNRPCTWVTANRPDDQSGMIQSMAGWSVAQMYVRYHTVKVYELLYNTPATEMDCSADGLTFSGILKNRRREANKKVHVDAGITAKGSCIQGVVNLITQNKGDACFGCYPGSHKYHSEYITSKRNWYALTAENKTFLEDRGLVHERFTMNAGDMMLFYSKTAHSQAHPIRISVQLPRMVHYVCALPKDRRTQHKTCGMKRKAYEENRATSHYPNYTLGNMKLFSKRLGNGIEGRYRRDVRHLHKASRMKITDMPEKLIRIMGLDSHKDGVLDTRAPFK